MKPTNHKNFNSGKRIRIATWNINGLRSGLGQVKSFLKNNDIDVLALQEIKIHGDKITDEVRNIAGYQSFFNPAEKQGYSGTAFYTRDKPQGVETGIGDPLIDREGRVICIKIAGFEICNFYFPHSSRDLHRLDFKMNFNKKSHDFIKGKLSDNMIVCGDFNVAHNDIDLARPKENRKNAGFTQMEREYFDKFLSLGLLDVYRQKFPKKQEFTWWGHFYNMRARNIGWRIDYFLTKRTLLEKIKKVEIAGRILGSDHCPVIIELN